MQEYIYDGPVTLFGTCILNRWKTKTTAVSSAKARSNLKYRFKVENGLVPSSKVDLPGKLREV